MMNFNKEYKNKKGEEKVILILIIILVICGVMLYKNKKKEEKKNNILILIVFLNNLFILALYCILDPTIGFGDLWIYLPVLNGWDNIWGIIIFLLVNITTLILSKKISGKKVMLVIGIFIYFLLIFFTPARILEGHTHVFEEHEGTVPYERIEEYKIYYNCYNIKIYE